MLTSKVLLKISTFVKSIQMGKILMQLDYRIEIGKWVFLKCII